MPVNARLRYEILRRDGYTCRYCGAKAPDVLLHVDHVVPVALGGTDDPSNLAAACKDCNLGKSSSHADESVVAQVNSEADAWGRAVRQAASESTRKAFDAEVAEVAEVFDGWYQLTPQEIECIRQKLLAGLPMSEVVEAAQIARYKPYVTIRGAFPYFMGVCRRKLEAIHERAEEILKETAAAPRLSGLHVLICRCGAAVAPFDDEPDEPSLSWQSAYRCGACDATWTAPWNLDGTPIEGHDYSPAGLGGGV